MERLRRTRIAHSQLFFTLLITLRFTSLSANEERSYPPSFAWKSIEIFNHHPLLGLRFRLAQPRPAVPWLKIFHAKAPLQSTQVNTIAKVTKVLDPKIDVANPMEKSDGANK